jgi:hypothetical protein
MKKLWGAFTLSNNRHAAALIKRARCNGTTSNSSSAGLPVHILGDSRAAPVILKHVGLEMLVQTRCFSAEATVRSTDHVTGLETELAGFSGVYLSRDAYIDQWPDYRGPYSCCTAAWMRRHRCTGHGVKAHFRWLAILGIFPRRARHGPDTGFQRAVRQTHLSSVRRQPQQAPD